MEMPREGPWARTPLTVNSQTGLNRDVISGEEMVISSVRDVLRSTAGCHTRLV